MVAQLSLGRIVPRETKVEDNVKTNSLLIHSIDSRVALEPLFSGRIRVRRWQSPEGYNQTRGGCSFCRLVLLCHAVQKQTEQLHNELPQVGGGGGVLERAAIQLKYTNISSKSAEMSVLFISVY